MPILQVQARPRHLTGWEHGLTAIGDGGVPTVFFLQSLNAARTIAEAMLSQKDELRVLIAHSAVCEVPRVSKQRYRHWLCHAIEMDLLRLCCLIIDVVRDFNQK